ncbi:MAG: hypothetical protein ACI9RM_002513 [Ulvibacter sp.]|jgi:hypothetical protein
MISNMFIPKFKTPFLGFSDSKFSDAGQNFIAGLTANDLFPNIADGLAEFKTVFDKYFLSIPTPSTRNKVNLAAKKANMVDAKMAMLRLTNLAAYQANFNEEAMKSTNLEVTQPNQSKGQVGLVENMGMVTNGEDGLVIVHCKKDTNATKYYVRISLDGLTWFKFSENSTRKVKVKGLPVGVMLYVQMQLENSHGVSPWSNTMTGKIAGNDIIATVHK